MQSTVNVFSNSKKMESQNLKCSLTKDSGWVCLIRKINKKAKHLKPLGQKQKTKYLHILRCITFQTNIADPVCRLYRKCSKLNEFSVHSHCDT